MKERELISIVSPVYNESDGIEAFYERLKAVATGLEELDHELIFVDDGSRDESFAKLCRLAERDEHVSVIKFSRNFGHQLAITAGLDHARGDCVVVIDSDLQDPPEVIPRMVAKWRDGFDVVYGTRSRRDGEGAMKLFTASVFYRLLRRLTNIEIPVDVGDFRLLSRRAADEVRAMRENDRFVRGLVSWVGFRQVGVEYDREPRFAGETKYPYRKMLKFALDGITSFSTVPLKLATWLGYAASIVSFLMLLAIFPLKWMGFTISGWASLMVGMLFMGGVQLVCLGIVGEYIGRIFIEMKRRPLYVVEAQVAGARRTVPAEPARVAEAGRRPAAGAHAR
jgi:glycosyltransferase involved in cell wall biosynthesis